MPGCPTPGLHEVYFAVPALTSSSVLGESLHLLPRSLRQFRPEFQSSDPEPRTSCSVLVDPQRDHLCISIRTLSSQLRKLHISGLRISPAIFAGNGDGSYPDWSRLEEIKISYPVISSTGEPPLSPSFPKLQRNEWSANQPRPMVRQPRARRSSNTRRPRRLRRLYLRPLRRASQRALRRSWEG